MVFKWHGTHTINEKVLVVPISQSEVMVDSTVSYGGMAQLHVIKDKGHNDGIDYAYRETDLIQRLLAYRKTDFTRIPEPCEQFF